MDLLCPLNPPAGEHDIITAFDQILDGPQQNDFPLLSLLPLSTPLSHTPA